MASGARRPYTFYWFRRAQWSTGDSGMAILSSDIDRAAMVITAGGSTRLDMRRVQHNKFSSARVWEGVSERCLPSSTCSVYPSYHITHMEGFWLQHRASPSRAHKLLATGGHPPLKFNRL